MTLTCSILEYMCTRQSSACNVKSIYCGIVYADNMKVPGFVMIYDSKNRHRLVSAAIHPQIRLSTWRIS